MIDDFLFHCFCHNVEIWHSGKNLGYRGNISTRDKLFLSQNKIVIISYFENRKEQIKKAWSFAVKQNQTKPLSKILLSYILDREINDARSEFETLSYYELLTLWIYVHSNEDDPFKGE